MEELNYERLFDILREERNNIKLQLLSPNFYSKASEYLKLKSGSSEDQLKNAKRIIEDIYQRREKKVLTLALSKSRTKSNLIDTGNLLPEENLFFKQTVILLDHFREDILGKVFSGKIEETEEIEEIPEAEPETPKAVKLKFLKYTDKFVGPDLDILGPFEEGDFADLPAESANLLILKGLAEKFVADE